MTPITARSSTICTVTAIRAVVLAGAISPNPTVASTVTAK